MAAPLVLRLVRERKLKELLPVSHSDAVFEASGVFAKGTEYFVVFDNTRRVARIASDLKPGSTAHTWVGRPRASEGYEDIAYSFERRRFYLLIEAEKHPDGTYKAVIEEADDQWRLKGRSWINFSFSKRNTGFEGLSALHWRGTDYLLALCEGNRCRSGRKKRKPGGGRIQVLEKRRRMWEPVARIKLPRSVKFKDYSALALKGDRIAVISQESSRLWLGMLRRNDWTIEGAGRVYRFPKTRKGKRRYFTLEGLSWLSPSQWVVVSDLCGKRKFPKRCKRTDQSIHIFQLTRRRSDR
jgi:hypothetical protein